jgi:hypothetical protein
MGSEGEKGERGRGKKEGLDPPSPIYSIVALFPIYFNLTMSHSRRRRYHYQNSSLASQVPLPTAHLQTACINFSPPYNDFHQQISMTYWLSWTCQLAIRWC